ncbi:hypothetical protein vseg_014289 [Gypsophila vaccaria]
MREDSNWFSKWEDELPSPEELMPLSQTLISPDLASIFDIRNPNGFLPPPPSTRQQHNSAEQQLDSSSAELCGGVGRAVSGSDEPGAAARTTLKRPRLVWTPQLHKRFVDAVAHLGIKNAVPKTIMQLMNVDGLTRENVASHLQKYRLYLKRMHGNGPGHAGGPFGPGDSASDRLFASSPVPAHFLRPATAGPGGQHIQGDDYSHHYSRQTGHFGSGQIQKEFDHMGHRNRQTGHFESDQLRPTTNNGNKILTLFPSAE